MCGAPELLDGELALHPGLSVAGHRAVERVAPGREVGLELRHAPVLDDLALALAVDDDVVRRAGLVGHLDRDLPGRPGRRVGHEGQLAGRIGVDLKRAALLDGRLAPAGLLYGGAPQPGV